MILFLEAPDLVHSFPVLVDIEHHLPDSMALRIIMATTLICSCEKVYFRTKFGEPADKIFGGKGQTKDPLTSMQKLTSSSSFMPIFSSSTSSSAFRPRITDFVFRVMHQGSRLRLVFSTAFCILPTGSLIHFKAFLAAMDPHVRFALSRRKFHSSQ